MNGDFFQLRVLSFSVTLDNVTFSHRIRWDDVCQHEVDGDDNVGNGGLFIQKKEALILLRTSSSLYVVRRRGWIVYIIYINL